MTRILRYRLLAYLSGILIGGVFLSLFTVATTHTIAIIQAVICAGGIFGLWFSWGRESQAIERIIYQEALAARQAAENQFRPRDESRSSYARAPDAAKALHETTRAHVQEVRTALTRLWESIGAEYHDRCAVYEDNAELRRLNDHYASQIEVANQAKDVMALLQAPPLAPGERPWPPPRLVENRDTEGLIQRLTEHIEGGLGQDLIQERANQPQ